MQIHLNSEFVWSDRQQKYLLVKRKSVTWAGEVAFLKGASSAQNNLANQQSQFYSTLQQDYGTQFANQSAILGSLNKTLSPIVNAGPNQFGFSQGQTNNLNSQALQGTATAYANASKNLKENQATAGGGNSLLPNGAQNQQQASLAASAANNQSNQLLGIQQQGYDVGRQNFNNAVSQLGGVAGQYNPSGYAGQATGAGNAAANTDNQIAQANNAASPWNLIGGILGGAASGFASGLGGGLGKAWGGGNSGGGSNYNTPSGGNELG